MSRTLHMPHNYICHDPTWRRDTCDCCGIVADCREYEEWRKRQLNLNGQRWERTAVILAYHPEPSTRRNRA